MGENSSIQWTTHTFNPWIGCQRVSPGCQHCYAESYDKRVGGALVDGVKTLRWGPTAPRVRTSAGNWKKPLAWNRAAEAAGERHRVFCSSLADVFERLQPGQVGDLDSWRLELFDLIASTPHLDWLLLTKRPELIKRGISGAVDAFERTAGCVKGLGLAETWLTGLPPANVWLGTTVEDQQRADERIPALLEVPAVVRLLSCEPLLERVTLNPWLLSEHGRRQIGAGPGIAWVIIGGESGHGARPFMLDWARDLVRQCRGVGVAPFVKQLGRRPMNSTVDVHLRDSAGGDIAEWPADLRIREFPAVGTTPAQPGA